MALGFDLRLGIGRLQSWSARLTAFGWEGGVMNETDEIVCFSCSPRAWQWWEMRVLGS